MADAPGPSSAPPTPPRGVVLGVPLALAGYDEVVEWIEQMVQAGARGYLTAAAVHLVMLAREDAQVRDAVLGATLVVPDGQPLVWALRLLGHDGISARVYGPDLMLRWCERAATSGRRAYLYGGRNEGALVALTVNLRTRFPGLQIVGGHSPPFRETTDEEDRQIAAEIDGCGAEVVWVGTGQPKQELWMARMRPALAAPMLVGVGAAFDFHAGLVPQAPPWMGRHGLEWTYRLVREPRRLARRYVRYNPRFAAGVARQYATARLERARARTS